MRKHIILIPVVMVAAVAVVVVLASAALRPLNEKNGFVRKFVGGSLEMVRYMQNKAGIEDFGESTDNRIYFKTDKQGELIVTDTHLSRTETVKLNFPDGKKLNSPFYSYIDSPLVTLLLSRKAVLIKLSPITDPEVRKLPLRIFTRVAKLPGNCYAFRGFDSLSKKDQVFIKVNIATGQVKREVNISERNEDAGISTDGRLLYDKEANKLIYIFYYRNQFLVMDTNLNLVFRGIMLNNHITPHIKAGLAESKTIITNLSPGILINGTSHASNGLLFNQSLIRADNESNDFFSNHSPIDIYDLTTGNYIQSLYIPVFKSERMNKFKIFGNSLIAIYKSNIVHFKFRYMLQQKDKPKTLIKE